MYVTLAVGIVESRFIGVLVPPSWQSVEGKVELSSNLPL
jgi:hypothetical protein